MQSSNFNLLDIVAAIQKKWKAIVLVVFIAMFITTVTLFIVPKYYKAETVAVVQNPVLADKSRWFNHNIQNLYSSFGSGDDLDIVYGFSKLDTIYYQLVDEFNLVVYYNADGSTPQRKRRNAFLSLKDDLEIKKNETNLLSIIAFAKEAQMAANMANRATELVQLMQQQVWKNDYLLIYNKLIESVNRMEKQVIAISDTIQLLPPSNVQQLLLTNKRQMLLEQIQKYRKEADDLQLAAESTPTALYVLDKAVAASVATRPDKLLVLTATFFAAIFFAILTVLIIERKNN